MNKARINEIEKFKATIAQLVTVTAQHNNQVEELKKLKKNQQKQRAKLSETKK